MPKVNKLTLHHCLFNNNCRRPRLRCPVKNCGAVFSITREALFECTKCKKSKPIKKWMLNCTGCKSKIQTVETKRFLSAVFGVKNDFIVFGKGGNEHSNSKF